ncbi:uncharacterized protein LOC141817146 [Curcuma longa]|uniref:uncharacterized protein LOC141817146 n=1 Tax=Curcuma longa TaxID=136217 RepID=UPI003D9F9B07
MWRRLSQPGAQTPTPTTTGVQIGSLPRLSKVNAAQKFEWNKDCDKAFSELKEYLSQLPRLAKPSPSEPLWMYLSASDSAASSVLVKQEAAPILLISSGRSHDQQQPGPTTHATGRSPDGSSNGQWNFREYDIQYQPRTAIKAQALADFLTEIPKGETEQIWKVYVDGSSNRQGSGIGVVLISPQEEEIRLSIRLSFRASNNEAEYEAVLAGLQAAKRMGAARVSAAF